MIILFWAVCIILLLVLIVTIVSYLCFRHAFYVKDSDKLYSADKAIPEGDIYIPWREQMLAWIEETRQMPCQQFQIQSFDGLTLQGKYYEYAPGAPIELLFHGYRGYAERDLCGAVQRCFALGHNAFLVDQRASGSSGGNVITFGVNESKDCLDWLSFVINHFGPEVKVILCGMSMGASTVLNATGSPLPKNVIGVLADCGFSSTSAIIKKVIGEMGLPADLAYLFVKLGARIFGGFDPDAIASESAVANCNVPVIFFHGEDDAYVPCEMSRTNYNACQSRKALITVPGAGHGLSYLVAPEQYLQALRDFFSE